MMELIHRVLVPAVVVALLLFGLVLIIRSIGWTVDMVPG